MLNKFRFTYAVEICIYLPGIIYNFMGTDLIVNLTGGTAGANQYSKLPAVYHYSRWVQKYMAIS